MIVEIALGILLAFVILATAVIWIPLVVGLVGLALVAATGYGIWLYPEMVAFPAAMLAALVAMAWVFQRATLFLKGLRQ